MLAAVEIVGWTHAELGEAPLTHLVHVGNNIWVHVGNNSRITWCNLGAAQSPRLLKGNEAVFARVQVSK